MASTSISTRSPPRGNGNDPGQGILGRFLRRAKSTKGSTRSRRRSSAEQQDNLSGQRLTDGAEGAFSNLGVSAVVDDLPPQQLSRQQLQSGSATLPQIGSFSTYPEPQLRQQRLPRSQATTPEMLTEMAQPRLKKKASIRDRLKSWQKPAQSTISTSATKTTSPPSEQPKRFVYQPKHAASDFSRMVISPASPSAPRRSAKQSFDEDSTLSPSLEQVDARHAIPVLEDDADLVKPRRASPPLQTLVENEIVADGHAQRRQGKQRDELTRSDAHDSTLQRSRSGARRRYEMVEDPWMASQAAAHVPIGTIPVRTLSAKNRSPKPQQPEGQDASPIDEQESSPAAKAPLSDFEAFLAQAEADERAQREQVLRSFTHHSNFHSANYVKPNPHRQFAKVGGGDLSGTTVGPGLASVGGSRSSRGGSQRTSGQYALSGSEDQYRPRVRHKKQSSWTPSFGADSDDIERSLEKCGSNTWGPPLGPTSRARRPQTSQSQKVVYSVDESFHQPEQPRTLRRQTSITQRIAEYIKPAREVPAAGGSEQTLYHSASRSGLRRTGSQRQPRGFEALPE